MIHNAHCVCVCVLKRAPGYFRHLSILNALYNKPKKKKTKNKQWLYAINTSVYTYTYITTSQQQHSQHQRHLVDVCYSSMQHRRQAVERRLHEQQQKKSDTSGTTTTTTTTISTNTTVVAVHQIWAANISGSRPTPTLTSKPLQTALPPSSD